MTNKKRKNTYFRRSSRDFKASKFIRNIIHINKNIPIQVINYSKGKLKRTLNSLKTKERLSNLSQKVKIASRKNAKK